MNATRKITAIAVLMCSTSLIASEAFASSLTIHTQSAHGVGTALAGAAANPGSLSYMFFNPATIADYDGYTVSGSGTLAPSKTELTNVVSVGGAGTGESSPLSLIPALYGAAQLTDKVNLGVSLNAPFGTTADYGTTWPGRFVTTSAEISTRSLTPVVSYKFSDQLAIAAGLQVAQSEVTVSRINAAVPPFTDELTQEADGTAFGFTLGVLGEPAPGTRLGLSWRSQLKHDLEGNLAAPFISELNLPHVVSFGLTHDATERLKLQFGLEWTGWSSMEGSLTTVENNDTWFTSVGAEYDLNDSWSLRGGIGYDESPTPSSAHRSPVTKDEDRYWLSLGGSYHVNDALSFDLGYAYIKLKDTKMAHPRISADSSSHAHVLSVGASYSF